MHSQDSTADCTRYILQVYVGALSLHYEALSVEASKQTTAEEIVSCIVERLGLTGTNYELAEVAGECKERRLSPHEKPVSVMLLWPMHSERDFHRFYLRETQSDVPWLDNYGLDPQILRDFLPFLLQPENREYPDLCQLPDLNESTLLENLRQRFEAGHIYTYVGSILIAVNPFKFHPIYNPKYVRLYQNQRIGPILPPHIFAIADNAYYCMLKEKRNQCVVISGESGSGKTESTNFLLHHLTALSQKGSHGSGVEQTILSAGPVLEAFGNAKTAHNNNSSRFGKFIQVNYRENGMVQGAVVQKYLLEKSRIVSQGSYERNYHVFYYLLSGATEQERDALHLLPAVKYHYLNAKNLTLENCDEKYEFSRLKQSMEMVGFSAEKQRRLFNVLSAVLLLGNVEFFPKKSTYHHDESVQVRNPEVVAIISELLKVKQETLMAALTSKRVKASGETLIMQYKLPEAIAARDALAKCLYGALFDWIVLQVNHALLNKDQTPHTGHSIGVLDIFGFEDFGPQNSFEQLCINYANEHLQYYFNLHVFKYEQKEYKREGIKWTDIEFMDNSGCLHLFESKPTGLLCILDDLCNFPGSTNEMLLQKFNSVQKDNQFYEKPQRKESAFIIKHYAGKVKYQVAEMREKNLDLMRQDIVSVLKNSSMAFVRELVGADPVAVFRWAILRAFFRGYFAFRFAGIKHRRERNDQSVTKMSGKTRFRTPNENLLSKRLTMTNDLTTNYMQRQQQSAQQSLSSNYTTTSSTANNQQQAPRRSWSSFAFNHNNNNNSNSSNNGGKLTFECSQLLNSNNSNNDKNSHYHIREQTKFERSSQDVMARASQIVMKNKSFRPRERPKKGLKNLQSVKTLTAGQNLSNQTSVKTRKQPLTVTAQFQNSLIALMETLNQANPFFIRCIKSNPNKIPNQFDDATVTRQLRYTGMLETVRIRRAGYNVRLTYEEFIQLYRILLPKGLVSSQKDVRDFMNTMDLNKQHYQLGITKIYMRESQKMRLDIKLHTRIIESIISIQRWFRGILQRRKFLILRTATVTIQSYWRMWLVQRQLKHQEMAAISIQSIWRMYLVRKWYLKLCNGIVVVQSHIRGKLARKKYCYLHSKKNVQKTRIKLRSTQSLPVNDNKSMDELCDAEALKYTTIKPHYSLDIDVDNVVNSNNATAAASNRNNFYTNHHINYNTTSPSSYSELDQQQQQQQPPQQQQHKNNIVVGVDPHTLYRLEAKTRDLMLDREHLRAASNYNSYNSNNSSNIHKDQVNMNIQQQQQVSKDYQRDSLLQRQPQQQQQDVIDKPSTRSYDLDRAAKNYYEDAESLKRFETIKAPVRRLDSGPSPIRREIRYDNTGGVSVTTTSNKNNINNVEIVVVPSSGATTTIIGGSNTQQRNTNLIRNQNIQIQSQQQSQLQHISNSIYQQQPQSPLTPTYQNIMYSQQQQQQQQTSNSSSKLLNQQSSSSQYSSQSSLNSNPTSPYYNANSLSDSISATPPAQQQVNDDFLQKGFYSTPKGKAAALLGTISEDNLKKQKEALAAVAAAEQKIATATSKRRVKTNLSDEFIGSTAANSQTNYNPNPFLVRRGDIKSTDSLKRRNSDPTNKIPLLEVNRGNDMYQSTTNINIAGHRLRKISRISKTDKCASCNESDSFVNEGYRCLDCKVLLHTKCIQNGGIKSIQCDTKRSKRLRKTAEKSLSHGGGSGIYNSIGDGTPNSKCSGTREYTDSTDKIISDAKELQLMQDFITQKICKMDNDCEKSSEVDRVFKQALREFKDNLVAQYSVAHKQNSDVLNIKYRDLIANFEQVMETSCGRKDDFPLTMGVNAFRGFMNEFMSSRDTEKPKTKRKKEKKRKVEEHTSYNGHTFQLTIINIATACEICQLFLLWPIERGLVCQNCRLTCHKKCYQKSGVCSKISSPSVQPHYESSTLSSPNSKLFGVPLTALCAGEGGVKIPSQVDQIITKIEMHGLYAEGLYRKSGVSSKIKELKSKMSDVSMRATAPEVDYESYNVHVLANVLKSFLREMPEPLLSFDRYDDFLRASDLSDHTDRVQTLLSLIKKLPPAHHALLERLIFHLALVAQREQYNRMSASSLAIVFAPCVLRTNRYVPAQDSLNDIGRQTKCMETLITQKMLNVKSTLADIDTLDTAAHTATTRLSTLRSSKVFTPEEFSSSARSAANLECEAEEMLLEGHIQEIKKEKALLTSTLPSLARASSDDDLLSTDLDGEGGSLDDLSSGGGKEHHHYQQHGSNDNMRDSVDSAVYSLGDNTSRQMEKAYTISGMSSSGASSSSNRDITNAHVTDDDYEMMHHEPVASYSLRDQNIDYLPATTNTSSSSLSSTNHHHRNTIHHSQQSMDRDAFMKNLTKTGDISSSKYSGSQQNLISNISIGGGSSSTSGKYGPLTHGTGSACELQRQKPIVMRSISTGYDTTTTLMNPSPSASSIVTSTQSSSSSGLLFGGQKSVSKSGRHNTTTTTITDLLSGGNNNKDNKDSKNNNRKSTKRQNSVDDEPIMV